MPGPRTPDAAFVIDPADPAGLAAYLDGQGWIDPGEPIRSVDRAGEGNMNLTLRVVTDRRRLIVKQGLPWVHKYPTIPAPADRTLQEAGWYRLAATVAALADRMPTVLGLDLDARILALSDLGDAGDLTDVYAGRRLPAADLDALVDWLVALHGAFAGDERAAAFANREMRALNHEHIFEVPLRPGNGLDLDAITPGLAAAAAQLRTDLPLRRATAELGAVYLGDAGPPGAAPTLLHGDYYPGSWLHGEHGPMVIDPEFGFGGAPELDLGVMLAHLTLSGHDPAVARAVERRYRAGAAPGFDTAVAWGFAGVEVVRRLLGVSQLPLPIDLAAKRDLLEQGAAWARAAG